MLTDRPVEEEDFIKGIVPRAEGYGQGKGFYVFFQERRRTEDTLRTWLMSRIVDFLLKKRNTKEPTDKSGGKN